MFSLDLEIERARLKFRVFDLTRSAEPRQGTKRRYGRNDSTPYRKTTGEASPYR
jgi:hypothetical protein